MHRPILSPRDRRRHIDHSHDTPSTKTKTKHSSTSGLDGSSLNSTKLKNTSVDSVALEAHANQEILNHIAKKKRQTQDLWGLGSHLPANQSNTLKRPEAKPKPFDPDEISQWLKNRSEKAVLLNKDRKAPCNCDLPYMSFLIDKRKVALRRTSQATNASFTTILQYLSFRHSHAALEDMAKPRKKKRTHVPNNDGSGKPGQGSRLPKSMVVRMGAGDVGSSVTQLARDFRAMMEPDTASRLKERRANKLKDYTAMTGPLGVTHLFLFSRSKSGNVHLRVALTPRGPTLTFRIDHYALCKDIVKAQKHPRGGGKEYLNAPLLVMNNFTSQAGEDPKADPIKKQLESLTTTIFQSIFPPISPQTTPLNSIRRILLLNREPQADGTYIISLRHYAITTRRTGVSKRVRRFDPSEQRLREKKSGALPNLGKLEDVADYLLDPSAGGYTSASETELDTDAEVEVLETTTQRVLSKREQQRQEQTKRQQNGDKDTTMKDSTLGATGSNVEKRAVKLVELGPRMRLRMVKVEEGICEGRVMWNEFVTKTKDEEKKLDEKWEKKRQEKEARKKEQRENVERKRLARRNAKLNSGKAREGGGEEENEDEEWDSDELDAWDEDDDLDEDAREKDEMEE